MNKYYFLTRMEKDGSTNGVYELLNGEKKDSGFPDFGNCEICGFWEDRKTAKKKVEEFGEKGKYPCLLIERIRVGVYPDVSWSRWYQWNLGTKAYEETEKDCIFCNFALG